MSLQCKICGNDQDNQCYSFSESMYGSNELFEYFQCSKCDCLQANFLNKDLSKYYPTHYHSFNTPEYESKNLISRLRKMRNLFAVWNQGVIGLILYAIIQNKTGIRSLSSVFKSKSTQILDVGCGSGNLLFDLYELGFKKLTGIDPFIKEDIHYNDDIFIKKADIMDLSGTWNLIMLHHTLEHIPDQISTIQKIKKLLAPNGVCIIRIPTTSSYAWDHYKENWIQLDPPRHLYLHSIKSMTLLAKKAGLKVSEYKYDSNDFQFWGSTLRKKNIPLFDPKTHEANRPSFTIRWVLNLKARYFNKINKGDQIAFFLHHESTQ